MSVVVRVSTDYISTMPNLALHQSSSADQRVDKALAWLERQDTSRGALVIGASRTSADELVRAVAMDGKAVFGWTLDATVGLPRSPRFHRTKSPLTRYSRRCRARDGDADASWFAGQASGVGGSA